MHEFSICERLVEIALDEAAARAPRRAIRSVKIAVGALQQIVPETLTAAFEFMTRDTSLEGAELKIRIVPVRVRCRQCGAENEVRPAEFICPNCGGVGLDVLSGRDIVLETLEVDEP